jgi:hypothetical protein
MQIILWNLMSMSNFGQPQTFNYFKVTMKKILLLMSILLFSRYSFASNTYEQKLYQQLKEISAVAHRDTDFSLYARNVANLNQILDRYERSGGEDQHLRAASGEFMKALNSWAKAKLGERSRDTYTENMRARQTFLNTADSQILLYETGLKVRRYAK